MTSEIFASAMELLDAEFRGEGIHATMLLDNFSGHKWREEKISNIKFIFFTPGLTSHVQPADAGIIPTMKAHYCRLTLIWSLDHEEAGEDDPFAIDLLTAMQFLKQAWDKVTQGTIVACWRHTGILPELKTHAAIKAIPEVEAAVENASRALNDLNVVIHEQSNDQQNLARLKLVDNIEELLEEVGEPQWVEDEKDDVALIAAVIIDSCST